MTKGLREQGRARSCDPVSLGDGPQRNVGKARKVLF